MERQSHTFPFYQLQISAYTKNELPIEDNCIFFGKGFSGYGRQLELIAAVGDGTDRVAQSHLPAELADDIDHGRAAASGNSCQHSLVDLFLRENPSRGCRAR